MVTKTPGGGTGQGGGQVAGTKAIQRYMNTLDEVLRTYSAAGITAVALVPTPLVDTVLEPRTLFVVTFRQAGEVHTYSGTYSQHLMWLAHLAARS